MPQLHDDGATVVVDLHGLSVDTALDVAEQTVEAALAVGRASVMLIHGSSTSDSDQRNHTIKHALADFFSADDWPEISSRLQREADLVLSLDLTKPSAAERITLADVFP